MADNSLASRLADAGHFAAREAEIAAENAKSFGHAADAKNALFFRTLGLAYFAISEALFAGLPVSRALESVRFPRDFDSRMSLAYQAVISRVAQTGSLDDVPLSSLVPVVYKSH